MDFPSCKMGKGQTASLFIHPMLMVNFMAFQKTILSKPWIHSSSQHFPMSMGMECDECGNYDDNFFVGEMPNDEGSYCAPIY